MASMARKLFLNTSYLIVSNIISGIIMLLVTAYLARSLGVDAFGNFSYVISFVFFFVILSNLGIDTILTRELSKPEQDWNGYVRTSLSLKTALSLLAIGIIVVISRFINPELQWPIIIRASVLLFMAYTQTLSAVFQAKIKLLYPAIANAINKMLFFILAALVLSVSKSLTLLIAATSLSFLAECILLSFFARDIIDFRLGFNAGIARKLLKESLPLALSTTFYMVYLRVDVLMLQWMKSAEAVGFYTAAFNLSEALNMVPGAFMTAVFPLMAKYHDSEKDKFSLVSGLSMKFLYVLVFPMVAGVVLLAKPIIILFYGQAYLPSVAALAILIFSTGFVFLSIGLTKLIIVREKTNLIAWVAFIGALVNVGLNLYFIPRYGMVGASITTAATEGLIAVIWLYHIYASHRILPIPQPLLFGKIILATAIMAVAVAAVPGTLWIPIITGLLVYGLLILLFHIFSPEERALLWELWPGFR